MKSSLKSLSATLLALMLLLPACLLAQEMPQVPQLPLDPETRIGKLPNGLTYYIRHNEKPKGQADFYIAQKVGSIQEEDNQRGLAHFLEHMCFNGTTHFPDSMIVTWLEGIGVKFGVNLNAYTATDETVYNISNVPVERVGVQDSVLLILHDWANDLLLSDKEIDKERGVIHEEWRSRNTGVQRILEKVAPTLYAGSPYAHRMPIGTMEVVDNFPYQDLSDYYEKWYRPDLQGIVVVGDIDPDRIEAKIKEMFSDIEMPANPAERVYPIIPDHAGTIWAVESDPELPQNLTYMFFLSDPLPTELRNTEVALMQNYMNSIISIMINGRLSEVSTDPNCPFAMAQFIPSFGYLMTSRGKDADCLIVVPKGDDMGVALEAAYRVYRNAMLGGFSESEFERAKAEYLATAERAFNNRDSRENVQFVNQAVRHFLDGDPILPIEIDYRYDQDMANQYNVQFINQILAMGASQKPLRDNSSVLVMMNPKDGVLPTVEQLEATMAAVDNEEVVAFVDNARTDPLVKNLPAPGTIAGEQANAQWGTTEYVLSNGARVIVKPTKFKEDEIQMVAYAADGTQSLSKSLDNAIRVDDLIGSNGLGDYSANDLSKYLLGKTAMVVPRFGAGSRMLVGMSTPKDLPTLMELLYMNMTAPNYDATEFESNRQKLLTRLHNQDANPQFRFGKLFSEELYRSSRRHEANDEVLLSVTPDQYNQISLAMTSNAADWTFIFVGNIDVEKFVPLMEQYIATLPGNQMTSVKSVPEWDETLFITPGKNVTEQTTKMDTPQTFLGIVFSGNMPFTAKNELLSAMAAQILSARFIKSIREDMGATYSVGVGQALNSAGNPANAIMQIVFPLKPEMKEDVLKVIHDEFDAVQGNIKPEELAKVKEYLVKQATEAKELNGGWLSAIQTWVQTGEDTFNGDVELINSITEADVQNYIKALLSQGNERTVIMNPEN